MDYQRRKVVLARNKKKGKNTEFITSVEEGMYNLTTDVSLATDFITATEAHKWMHKFGNNQFTIAEAILPLRPMWVISEL